MGTQQMQRAGAGWRFSSRTVRGVPAAATQQNQPAVERIRKHKPAAIQTAGVDPCRQAGRQWRTENESGAEGRAIWPNTRSAPFRRRHVGDIAKGRRDASPT